MLLNGMKQEDKDLLLRDLCARLPYGVKVQRYSYEDDVETIETLREIDSDGCMSTLECETLKYIAKPYLFPLSSMTEEQFMELKVFADLTYEGNTLELVEWNDNYKTLEFWLEEIPSYCVIKVFDWLNKNHFDYRGLIEKGLVIDATGLNIY
jgi:hypothetical protein